MSHDQPHPDDERVSRLLADARHTEPLPPEVAARLDRTLEGLAAGTPYARAVRGPGRGPGRRPAPAPPGHRPGGRGRRGGARA